MTDLADRVKKQAVLFDWGDTVMRVFPEFKGPMSHWPRVETMPGIAAALQAIRPNATVCLATNAVDSHEGAIRDALARCDLSSSFDHVFCFRDLGHAKPAPAFYRAVLGTLGLAPAAAFMVSDALATDVESALAVGLGSVWYNADSSESHLHPRCQTIHDLAELPDALRALGLGVAAE